jgi:transcriptional regulator with GAF, ATPase, and Fis domain
MSSAIQAPKRVFRGHLARTLLLILLVLSLLPALAMGGMAYLRARSLLREQIFHLLAAANDAQSQQISQSVNTGYLLLSRETTKPYLIEALETGLEQENQNDPAFNSARQAILDELQVINQPTPFFNQFIILKPDGRIHMASKREWEGKTLSGSPYLDKLRGQQNSLAVYSPTPLYTDSFVILTAVPYLDKNGNPAATILGIAESPTISDLIDKVAFFSTNQYFVTSDGEFIGANPLPNSFEKLASFSPSGDQKSAIQTGLLAQKQNGTSEFADHKNQPVLSAYNWLPGLEIGWVTEISETSLYQQVNSLLLFAVLLFGAIAALMALIIWQTTRRMVRPLIRLAQTVQSFAEGHWEKRAPVTRNDEIGLLAYSFNHMADELSDLYYSMESKVEDRTYQIRTAAEAAHIAISSQSLEELIQRTTWLIHERFGLAYAAIYLIDTSGKYAVYYGGAGPAETVDTVLGHRIEIDPRSTIGGVITSNKPKIIHFDTPDRITAPYRAGILAGALAEAGIPISIGEQVLGALDVQSYKQAQINEENISELQNLVNQIAPAVHSFQLLEATQVDLKETNLLYNASHQIAQAKTGGQVIQMVAQALEQTPFAAIILLPDNGSMLVVYSHLFQEAPTNSIPERLPLTPDAIKAYLPTEAPVIITNFEQPLKLPQELFQLARQMGGESVAILPVSKGEFLAGLLMLGVKNPESGRKRLFTTASLQPYMNLIELVTMALEKIQALESVQKGYAELQTLRAISQAISFETDLQALFTVLHEQINKLMGEVDFFVALYDPVSNFIHIPYIIENGEPLNVEPFPLGEGLTSILISTQKPLLLTEDIENKALELGAKVSGKHSKSWLGVPLMIGNEAIGAMVVQDNEMEKRFDEDDLRMLNTLASQVAVVARNTQLLENARQKAERERLLFDITNKIRRSTDIHSILQTTANELGIALDARRAHIEIKTENSPSNGKGSEKTNTQTKESRQ